MSMATLSFAECAEQARALNMLLEELTDNVEQAAVDAAEARWDAFNRRLINDREAAAVRHLKAASRELLFAIADLHLVNITHHNRDAV